MGQSPDPWAAGLRVPLPLAQPDVPCGDTHPGPAIMAIDIEGSTVKGTELWLMVFWVLFHILQAPGTVEPLPSPGCLRASSQGTSIHLMRQTAGKQAVLAEAGHLP